MNTVDYEKQGTDFLQKHNVTMAVKFLYHGPYFDDDKKGRDVYQITLTRNGESYSFRFGQSIINSRPGVRPLNESMAERRELEKKRLIGKIKSPTAYDVLSTIKKNDPGTFADFCSEFGYDTDSRKAEKTYFAVQEEYQNLRKLFSVAELDEMAEIQ